MNLKGSLPLLILHVLQGGAKHGYLIAKDIKQKSQGVLDFREGTLYPALHQLEQQGGIESFNEVENGRPRRYYRLTPLGQQMLAAEYAEWQRFSAAVSLVLSDPPAKST